MPVYQEPSLIPDLSVADNLRLGDTAMEPFRHWVAELGLPDLDPEAMIRSLPLASLRIVDLARALAIEPDVLLLDELTAALPTGASISRLSSAGLITASRFGAGCHSPPI